MRKSSLDLPCRPIEIRRLPRAIALLWLLASSLHGSSLFAQPVGAAQRRPVQSAWASLGVGFGTPSSTAGVIGGWYSRGALIVGAQYSQVSPFLGGDTRSSVALLAGARTLDSRAFLVATLGVAAARLVSDCSSCPSRQVGPTAAALAVSAQAVANSGVLGLTLGTFGVLGPSRVSHAGVAVSLALGWFGE